MIVADDKMFEKQSTRDHACACLRTHDRREKRREHPTPNTERQPSLLARFLLVLVILNDATLSDDALSDGYLSAQLRPLSALLNYLRSTVPSLLGDDLVRWIVVATGQRPAVLARANCSSLASIQERVNQLNYLQLVSIPGGGP
jgi:hypothetical protein